MPDDPLDKLEQLPALVQEYAAMVLLARHQLARQTAGALAGRASISNELKWVRSVTFNWNFYLVRQNDEFLLFFRKRDSEVVLRSMLRFELAPAPPDPGQQNVFRPMVSRLRWPLFLEERPNRSEVVFHVGTSEAPARLVAQLGENEINADSVQYFRGKEEIAIKERQGRANRWLAEPFIALIERFREWLISPEAFTEWLPLPTPVENERRPARHILFVIAEAFRLGTEASHFSPDGTDWLQLLPSAQRLRRFEGTTLLKLKDDGMSIIQEADPTKEPLALEMSYSLYSNNSVTHLDVILQPPDFLIGGELYDVIREKIEAAAIEDRIYRDLDLNQESFQRLMQSETPRPVIMRIQRKGSYHKELVLLRGDIDGIQRDILFTVWIHSAPKEGGKEELSVKAPPLDRGVRGENAELKEFKFGLTAQLLRGQLDRFTLDDRIVKPMLRLMLALSRWGGLWRPA